MQMGLLADERLFHRLPLAARAEHQTAHLPQTLVQAVAAI
jgi:hypothetical protein